MTQNILARCFVYSGIMLVVSSFCNLVNLINTYDNFTQDNSSDIVSAFDG